jgi:hypothetical protein
MLRRLRLVSLLAALVLTSIPALAWGPNGHAIVADIAQRHLNHKALQAVRQLLALEGDRNLAQVASWPDEIRKDHPRTGPWHYVDTPLDADGYVASRDCPRGNCIVDKLPHFVHLLADRSAAPKERLRALKWVVHLVGDIHQPLHNADNHDKGGNTVQLVYFGDPTNLHRVWDSALIQHALGLHMNPDYSIDRAAARRAALKLDRTINGTEIAEWGLHRESIDAAALQWSDHAHLLARQVAYGDLPSRRERRRKGWSERYQAQAWPVARTQLETAGIRLADVLNRTLGH